MKPSAAPASSDDPAPQNAFAASERAAEDESTGVPAIRSWTGIYWIVFGSMVLWIVLLALLTEAFS